MGRKAVFTAGLVSTVFVFASQAAMGQFVVGSDQSVVSEPLQFSEWAVSPPALPTRSNSSWNEVSSLPFQDSTIHSNPGRYSAGQNNIEYQPACKSVNPWLEELTFFAGIDGSKQPQDFGVNANLGSQTHVNWGLPIYQPWGIGLQVGTNFVASANAVQVYELVGEATGRTQSFSTIGLFQRTDFGFSWGFAYDYLYQKSFDTFNLSQWRMRAAYDVTPQSQIGATVNISGGEDYGVFGTSTPVTLEPITQGNVFYRRFWMTGTQTTFWLGMANGHGENNAVTGAGGDQDPAFLFGADILAPLNDRLAIYGETNMIMPADTGTVDAFLGLQWSVGGTAAASRRGFYSPLLPVASSTTFSVDLQQ